MAVSFPIPLLLPVTIAVLLSSFNLFNIYHYNRYFCINGGAAKGVRITVHVSADNGITARRKAIDMYVATQAELRDKCIEIAPIEVKTL